MHPATSMKHQDCGALACSSKLRTVNPRVKLVIAGSVLYRNSLDVNLYLRAGSSDSRFRRKGHIHIPKPLPRSHMIRVADGGVQRRDSRGFLVELLLGHMKQ